MRSAIESLGGCSIVLRTAAVLASLGQSGRHVDCRCLVSCERLKVRSLRLFWSSGRKILSEMALTTVYQFLRRSRVDGS